MLQRVQTLWWVLAMLSLVLLFFAPYGRVEGGLGIYDLGVLGFSGWTDADLGVAFMWPVAVLCGLAVLLLGVTVFCYRRRRLQLRLSVVAVVLELGLFGLMYYYWRVVLQERGFIGRLDWPFVMPLVAVVLTVLGLLGVRRDEAYLRRMDRLR